MQAHKTRINEQRKKEYREKGYWGDATLLDYWKMSVLSAPAKIAVIDFQGKSYTYAELDLAAGKVASYLKEAGVVPGDFVSLQLPGWSEFTVVYIACLKVGAVVNPLMPSFRRGELTHKLNKCRSKVLFIPGTFRNFNHIALAQELLDKIATLQRVVVVAKENKDIQSEFDTLENIIASYPPLEKCATVSADDVAVVLFTSGTESYAKGVMLTHNNLAANKKGFINRLKFSSIDVMMMPVPLAHATGLMYGVTIPLLLGAKSVLLDKFSAENCLTLIEREKCTCGMGPTTIVHDILSLLKKQSYDISSLRYLLCGGAPIPRKISEDAMHLGIKLLSVYGATESAPHCIVPEDAPLEKVITTDGTPIPGVEIRVVDKLHRPVPLGVEGEESSRGPNVFVGYLGEPELTESALDEDGWYYSGDLGVMDNDGYLRITGRKKDIIIRGGENISSVEVENILARYPNIREAGVVGMSDERLGERICAYVVPENFAEKIGLQDIQGLFVQMGVSKCKCPERIEILDKLPKTESGKIKKYLLRKEIEEKLKVFSC
ncbi:medium-chain fatty-acid--CoA ligase [Desulfosporosinus fructosivorans]|uniref:Medium-chain fatty-acid--CoA ligase n=1 Tax=Desulfosporosinus fructosivorans TaxID=2018669 RepID=A0A4Z0R8Z7_9FIRM|nr:medium-chain fatty-acid--CoA ligase [Desulfosporosinus fructosivorans]TGE39268.1 medium-chain fatty-acid--CoA ligase [Desulfosporosinus fructosivorans]